MKDTQTQIDLMSASVCENIRMASTVRYFARDDGSVNEKEFADWSNPIVHYTGSGNPNDSMIPIDVPNVSSISVSFINNKINELKETSGNSDFNRGATSSGVTAASAIAALQEAGSKLSRDMIKGSYRVFVSINNIIIELIRQFYDLPRCFRICGENGGFEFVSYSNNLIKPTSTPDEFGLGLSSRLPIFDIKVKAQKQSAFSALSQNELAKEFYRIGFFEPSRAEQALACLDMMEFEGKNIIADKINEKSTVFATLNELHNKLLELSVIVEKDHPELSGLTESYRSKYAEALSPTNVKTAPQMKAASSGGGAKMRSQKLIEKARSRASQIATPR